MQLFSNRTTAPWLILVACILIKLPLQAQDTATIPQAADLLEKVYSPKLLILKDDVKIDDEKFIRQYKSILKLNNSDDLKLLKSETDEYGITHNRYIRTYKGYPVAHNIFIFHNKSNQLESVNADMDIAIKASANIHISKTQAIQRAKAAFPAAQYAWEIPILEKERKEMMHNSKATYYPEAPLLWHKSSESDAYVLCYQVDLTTSMLEAKRLMINAATGALIYTYTLSKNCTPATASTIFYGNRSISTFKIFINPQNALYSLLNNCSPAFIHTRKLKVRDTTGYFTSDNNWAPFVSASTSHWTMQQSVAYFRNTHGRQGWNNANAGVNVYQVEKWANASALSGNIKIGEGTRENAFSEHWNTLDIVAHEYAHLVTESSADLVYEKESGALNESFSDIFGVACYHSNFGLTNNIWKICYDRTDAFNPQVHLFIRDMADPKRFSNPNTYKGTHWYSTTGPEGGNYWGVHNNSGVQNFMFYLLVAGGSGTNDNGLQYSINGIGFNDARRIAYLALTAYLTNNSNHSDARNAWVQAARNIFGACSFQAIQTGKAWDAVGLPPPTRDFNYVGNYTGVSNLSTSGIANLAPSAAMTVQPGANVSIAAKRVRMLPGFKAASGSYFRAFYGECFYAAL